jgi:protein-L-isoaspartate(D-aspartate) O-methyltransferase
MTPGRALAEAFAACPRAAFLPEDQRRFAQLDRPLPIGWGQTNSQPTTVRNTLELLDVRPGQRVLDVGCGSGWTTALLAHLVGPEGEVVGVEILPELVATGREHVARHPSARIEPAVPDTLGLPDLAPFDRILVSAEATVVPASLVEQLTDDGVLVVPVAGTLHQVRRHGAEVVDALHGRYSFVPLQGG